MRCVYLNKDLIRMKNIIFLSSIWLLSTNLFGQIPSGSWRDHLPYNKGMHVVEGENRIFQSSTGGLLAYDREDNSLEKHSKVTGLSDVNISSIAYSDLYQVLIIGYSSGNLDLMFSDEIFNISAIKLKSITGTKSINNISIYDELVYLACDFGIVVLNIEKREIKDTYIFGENGSSITVNDIDIQNDILFAATNEGIYQANLNTPNLIDYHFWSKINNGLPSEGNYTKIASLDNQILAVYKDLNTNNSSVISISDLTWNYWGSSADTSVNDITVYNDDVFVSGKLGLGIYDLEGNRNNFHDLFDCRETILDDEGVIWAATLGGGLVRIENDNAISYTINGPPHKDVGYLANAGGHIWVGSGNRNVMWNPHTFYSFKNENWRYYPGYTYPELNDMRTFYKIAIDPRNANHVYCTSFGFGIVEMLNDELITVYNESNGIIEGFSGYIDNLRVAGIDYDAQANLYFILDLATQPVYRINANGELERLDLSSSIFNTSFKRYTDILATSNNQVWILTEREGLIVLYENPDGSFEEKSFILKNDRDEIMNKAFCLAEDREGNIWVGTDNGPIVYKNPLSVFEDNDVKFYQEILPRNDGTNIGDPLLANEVVQFIAIDGGNRKWFATEHSGVFLIDDKYSPSKQVHHFTEENSPLFSNSVGAITVNDLTGEVFFGTSEGILSYMGQSTLGNEDYENVYVYPNPIRPTYDGDITITGLVENTIVKITDITGNIVHETRSLGGQAIWDGKDFDGERVHTGIYMVFLTTEDGLKTHMTKLMFIH